MQLRQSLTSLGISKKLEMALPADNHDIAHVLAVMCSRLPVELISRAQIVWAVVTLMIVSLNRTLACVTPYTATCLSLKVSYPCGDSTLLRRTHRTPPLAAYFPDDVLSIIIEHPEHSGCSSCVDLNYRHSASRGVGV